MEKKKMITIKRYIPSREDFEEPIDIEKLKGKGYSEEDIKKFLEVKHGHGNYK